MAQVYFAVGLEGALLLAPSPSLAAIVFLPLSASIKKRLAAAGKDGVLPRSLSLPPGIKPGVKIEAVKSGKKYKIKKPHQPGRPPKHHTRHPAFVPCMNKKAVRQALLSALPNCLHFFLTNLLMLI